MSFHATKNNFSTTLSVDLTTGSTSMSLTTDPSLSYPYWLTIGSSVQITAGTAEIVEITAKPSAFTIVRGAQGSTANTGTWASGTQVQLLETSGHLSEIQSALSNIASTVLATVLTGLSTSVNAVISATDTVLIALGKLQKQISDNLTTLTSHTSNTSNPHSVTASQVGLGSVTNNAQVKKISSSTNGNLVTWSGTTGDTVLDSGKSLPTGAIVGISDTQTLSNKTFSDTITSTLATGTAPLTVTSTTKVTNLNVEQVDGHDAGTSSNNVLVLDGSGLTPVANVPNLDWGKITTGKPTTLSGYGITDGANTTQESWIAPTLLNGWINWGSNLVTAGYFKDNFGIVHIKGCLKSGTTTINTIIFTLPVGYRPSEIHGFAVYSNDGANIGTVQVTPVGNVLFISGGNSSYFIDGITFRV